MADTWQAISGYASNNYSDTMVFEVDGATKKLQKISGQTLIAGEKNSQYIRFMMPRYWDGIDVSEKTISIIYGLAGQYYGETAAISAERTDDSLRFGWVVPEEACCIAGTLLFVLVIKDSTYVLKSQITEVPVLKSINLDDVIPEPTKEAWYADFQVRIERTLSTAENAVEEAQAVLEQARSFVGSPLVAETAAGMVDTDRIYVYTGSETGYTSGNWYYYNTGTSAWTSGGVYNAVAVDTDTTLTIAGKPADAKKTGDEISQIKEGLSEILEPYNLYDPSDTFIQTNNSGASRNGYTINTDGTITGIRTNGAYGSLFLVNENKTLKAGEYTLSCKITLNENAAGNNRIIATRIGRAASNKLVPMTTERGGSTNITTSDFVGWIKSTFTLSTDETFAFMVMPNDTVLASSSKPYVISDLQIEYGDVMHDYSPNNNSSIDLYARWKEELSQKSINSYGIVLKNNVGFIYTTSSARHSFTEIENGGLSVFIGGKLNFRILDSSGSAMYVQKTWEEISTSISDDITIDGDTATIVLSRYSRTLVYDISDGQLHIVNSSSANGFSTNYIPLVQNAYGSPVGGFIVEEYYHRLVNDMQSDSALTASDIFNGEPFTGTYDWQTPVVSYGALFKGKSNVEAFAFFTDPHIMGFGDTNRNETRMENYFKRAQKVYNSTPCSFIVCGGDLLNNATTMDEACYRLGYIKGIFKHLLDGCKLVIGNHDTNYQGKEDSESDNYTGRLTDATLASILYRDTDTKKAYYSFDGANSKCYVLDTGIEHSSMLAYDWEQVDWLANKLKTDDADHSIIFLHIIVSSDTVQTNASNFGSLAEAYNNHATITLNGVTYDFTACSGRVEFWVAGHTHRDSNGTLGGIPYFITASNSFNSDVPLIDLVLADYDNNVVKIIRAGGTGEDRTIQLT